jgi:Photosystem I psaA/psaB protein
VRTVVAIRLRFWFGPFAATHIDAFTVYDYLTKDFTAMSAIYTHHQYIAGFFLLGALADGLSTSSRMPTLRRELPTIVHELGL